MAEKDNSSTEFLINVKAKGAKEAEVEINAMGDACAKFGDILEELAESGKVEKFANSLRLMRKDAEELNKSLDEIIKKKEILK